MSEQRCSDTSEETERLTMVDFSCRYILSRVSTFQLLYFGSNIHSDLKMFDKFTLFKFRKYDVQFWRNVRFEERKQRDSRS